MSNNLFSQPKVDITSNVFANTNTTNQQQPNNIFSNNPAQTTNTSNATIFGQKQNPPQGTSVQQGANLFTANNNKPPTNQTGGGLFGAQQQSSAPTQQSGGNNIFGGVTSKPAESPILLGGKPAETKPNTGGGLFPTGQTATNQTSSDNLFGQKPQQATTNPQTGGGMFANNTAQQSANQPPANKPMSQASGQSSSSAPTNIFNQNKPEVKATQQKKEANLFGGNTTTNNPTGGIFNAANTATSNNTTNPPATTTNPPAQTATNNPPSANTAGTTGANLFAGNKPAINLTTSTTQPTPNLFTNQANNPPAQTTTTTNPNPGTTTAPTGGIFTNQSQPQNQPSSTGQQPNQQNPSTNPQVPQKTPAQKQFDNQASKTVKEFISTSRQQMQQMYTDLHKYSNNLLRYQQDRDQNIKIYKNFEEMKPQFINNADLNQRILTNLQQQQAEIENHLNLVFEAIKPQRTDHPLVQCLQDSYQLSQQVLQLQAESESQGGQGITHPSHQQLLLLYSTLDKLQTDIDRMNQLVSITFPESKSNQNYSYQGNRNNGFVYGYNQF